MYNGECIPIKDIKPALKNINVIFIVLELGTATITKENREVRNFKVGDHTACINVSIWDEPGKFIAPGDIIKLTKGYASIWRHCLTLYSGKNGEVCKIGEFCMTFNESVNMSEPKRPEPQQQSPQSLGLVGINTPQIPLSTGAAGILGTPTAGASQQVTTGGNGGGGSSTSGLQRNIPQIGIAGGTQPGGSGIKAANLQLSGQKQAHVGLSTPVTSASGSGPPQTSQGIGGTVGPPQQVKAARGGRTNVTRASNLKAERR